MKNKYFKWLGSGLLGVLTLASFSACEDDHFDLKSSTATTTLWENIKENDQLKDFASILEKTHVTRSEYIDQSDLTYAELLDQAQTFTVWAPVDGSYDASALLATLEAGDERTVEKEFIRNHLARYNYPSVTNEIMVPMMNSKMNRYALVDGVTYFKNQSVIGGAEPASNGTLHLLQGAAVFLPNLGDVARGTTNEGLDSLSAYIAADVDTLIFSPVGPPLRMYPSDATPSNLASF